MSWIKTRSGKRFDFDNLSLDNIDINDIAWSLSMQCRFSGHTKSFYSVAQHSVLCSILAPIGVDNALQRDALLHDATEAYVKDLPRPLKRLDLSSDYRKLEETVAVLIASKFNISYPFESVIHQIDNAFLRAEGELLMGGTDGWDLQKIVYDESALTLLKVSGFWTPEKAKRAFLDRYFELFKKDKTVTHA